MSHVLSDVKGQEEQCNNYMHMVGDDSFYLLASQEYEASLTDGEEYAEQYLEGKNIREYG